jgi:L-ascorbate metabolism protein UlaG (beta-lactamase superfamily)
MSFNQLDTRLPDASPTPRPGQEEVSLPNNRAYYLKPSIQVEPLFDHWYAWTHLICPTTAARNVTERHLKIMDSYLSAPQVHANAVKNPKMLGGPFVDYQGKRVDEIRTLRDRTSSERKHLLELSAAIAELDNILRTSATGYSLEPLYASVPDALKGYVELTYDLNHHPGMRFVESLLYRSRYYDRAAQSLMLSLTTGDDRPFVLSTPRLEEESLYHWRLPFDDTRVDDLFRTKTDPRAWQQIREWFPDNNTSDELLQTFFSQNPQRLYDTYQGNGVRWRYFGHACILVETPEFALLTDPVISYTYDSQIARYTYEDLPPTIDYVIITHNHQDHILFETLLQIRHKVKNIVVPKSSGGSLQDPSIKAILENTGFRNVVELDEMGEIEIGKDTFIRGLPFFGEHADLSVRSKLAFFVKLGRHRLLFAADSCNIEPELYKHIHHEVGDADAVFLGMECDGAPLSWLYGPLLTQPVPRAMDNSRRLAGSNFEQASDVMRRFNCREAYVYAMGQEPWLNYVMSIKYSDQSRPIVESNRLIEDCRNRGVIAERLFGEKEILLDA